MRGQWKTIETCKMYELKARYMNNEITDYRIDMLGKIFKQFKGYNCMTDAKRFWKNIKEINS